MANNLGTLFLNIANAIRSKNGLSTKYYPNQMADAILAIKTTHTLQNKSVSPSESSQTVVADSEYDGLGEVSVGAISSTYVGSGITRRDSTDLSANGPTVTTPSGYYSSDATKSVDTMALPTSADSSAASGYTRKATLGRSTSTRYINIPQGYNEAGGYYTISAVSNGTATGPSSISGSNATLTVGNNTITLTKTDVTTTPTVESGYISTATESTATVELTSSVTTKSADTYYATTTDQTISANQYLTGNQTIKALSQTNLSASNIKSGTTVNVNNGDGNVWSVTGTYTSDGTATSSDILNGETAYVDGEMITGNLVVTTVYVGSSQPSSSLGVDGDIYIKN